MNSDFDSLPILDKESFKTVKTGELYRLQELGPTIFDSTTFEPHRKVLKDRYLLVQVVDEVKKFGTNYSAPCIDLNSGVTIIVNYAMSSGKLDYYNY